MTDVNTKRIDQLWCKIAKTAVGAIFNVNQSILEVILGIPPIQIQRQIVAIKHYLKAVTAEQEGDNYLDFIMMECQSSNAVVISLIKDAFRFLEWKLDLEADNFTDADKDIVLGRRYDEFDALSIEACFYTKQLINQYTESLWQVSLQNRLQQIGERRAPRVSITPIPLPLGTDRKSEVLVLSLFYKQNLLNSFLYLSQRKNCPSPICKCMNDEQTAYHLLVSCCLVDEGLRNVMNNVMLVCNGVGSGLEEVYSDYISVINCARNSDFILNCLKIVQFSELELRTKYIISY